MSKPEWRDAPDWAHYLAQDDTGNWFWFRFEPRLGYAVWLPDRRDYDIFEIAGSGNPTDDWANTLEKRP